MPADHDARVARVVDQLRARRPGQPLSLRKKTVSHQVPKRADLRRRDPKIDIGGLDHILAIDEGARTCTAEPGVTFQRLVAATLPRGLVPLVVPEHKTITLGGAVAGCSVESMSFRHGGFHDSCLEYELVTAQGQVLRCTPDNEHRLIFQMVHGSFGTLGILTRLTFRLTPAKPFVHVQHRRFHDLGALEAAIARHAEDASVDFVDGQIDGPGQQVLTLGRFVDRAPRPSRYLWMRDYPSSMRRRREDHLSTLDYLFRYDRGVTHVSPENPLLRALFGPLVCSDRVLRWAERLHRLLPAEAPPVILDVFLPLSRCRPFLDWYHRTIGHYPIWCVPYRRVHDYEWLSPSFYAGITDSLYVDLAVYGAKQPSGRNLYLEIEEALLRFHGVKTLISYNYFPEDVFWRLWNRDNYQTVKRLTDPENVFRDLYAKTCRAALGQG